MTTQAIFGELRELVHTPSAQNFQDACALYEQLWRAHPERARDEVLPFLAAHMHSFEDELRILPLRWVLMWLEGQLPEELARLGRGISTKWSYRLTEQDVDPLIALTHLMRPVHFECGPGLHSAQWERIFGEGCFEELRCLELGGYREDRQDMMGALVASSGNFGALRELTALSDRASEEFLHQLESAPFARHLHTLSLTGQPELASWCACQNLMHGLRSLSLISYVRLSEADMHALAHCEQLATLEHLSLIDCQVDDQRATLLASSPYISKLQTLELPLNPIGSSGLNKLTSSKLIDGVRMLDLVGSRASASVLKRLGASKKLGQLEEISLHATSDGADDAFLSALAANPHVTSLRAIHANNSAISDQTVQALAARTDLGQLHTLLASRWAASSPTWRALFASPLGASLKTLEAQNTALVDSAGTVLDEAPQSLRLEHFRYEAAAVSPEQSEIFKAPALARLQSLTLGRLNLDWLAVGALPMSQTLRVLECDKESLDEEALVWLLERGHLAHIERLRLRRCELGARTIEALLAAGHITRLRSVDLGDNPGMGDIAARIFCSHHMLTLETIALSDVGMSGEALAAALAQLDHACPLYSLSVEKNPLGDAGVSALAESAHLGALIHLSLSECGLGEAGAWALAQSTNFRRCMWVHLGSLDLSAQAMQALRDSPNLPASALR